MSAYQQILIAVDLTEESEKICRKAIALSQEGEVNILLVHVVELVYQLDISSEPMFYPSLEVLSENEAQLIKVGERKMSELIASLSVPDNLSVESMVISGGSKTEILRLAEEKQVDLIVCGSHGRSGFELLLGSTANAILHHSPCDVLAVRTQKQKNN